MSSQAIFYKNWDGNANLWGMLEGRNLNITKSLSHIIKVFEDFKFVQELREEITKVKTNNSSHLTAEKVILSV